MEISIHKLNTTEGARFDIKECLDLRKFDFKTLKIEVDKRLADLLHRQPQFGKFFCLDYIDKATGEKLKLFIGKGMQNDQTQYWLLQGVCRNRDLTADIKVGEILSWLNIKVWKEPEEIINQTVATVLRKAI